MKRAAIKAYKIIGQLNGRKHILMEPFNKKLQIITWSSPMKNIDEMSDILSTASKETDIMPIAYSSVKLCEQKVSSSA